MVERLEYDPGRTAYIALLKTPNAEVPSQPKWSYMLAPQDLKPGGGTAWWCCCCCCCWSAAAGVVLLAWC